MSGKHPAVTVLTCKWCLPELPTGSEIPGGGQVVSVQCTGSIRPDLILGAFERGAQAVLIVGCATDACHFVTGNVVAGDTVRWTQDVCRRASIDPRRVRLELLKDPKPEDVWPLVDELRALASELDALELTPPPDGGGDPRDLRDVVQRFNGFQCLDCGKCTSVCSVAAYDTRFSPRGIVQHVLNDPRDQVLAGKDIWQCRACGRCTVRCPQNVAFSSLIRELRVEALGEGKRPQTLHGGVPEFLWTLGRSASFRHDFGDWPPEDARVDPESDVAFYPGCLPFYEATFTRQWSAVRPMETATAAIRLLNATGVRPRLVPEVGCCGHDLYWTGRDAAFREVAEANLERLEASGIKTLVTVCGECASTFGQAYEAAYRKPKFEVVHLMEHLAAQGDALEFANGQERTVTYHDACRLVRHLKVIEQPRQVIGRVPGVTLEEMPFSGERADCCGTAGWTGCSCESKRTQLDRLAMAKGTGADVLLASCPKCFLHYNCAREDLPEDAEPIPVQDVFTFLAGQLPG